MLPQAVADRVIHHVCTLVQLPAPGAGLLQHCAAHLVGMRLLLANGTTIKSQITLNVSKDDVALVIRENKRLERLYQLM
jgi:hypothetical protein